MSFSWTGRQLDSVTKNGVTTTYTYDSNGLRTSKTTGDDVTEYTYLGSSLVYQVTNKGQSDEESLYFYYDDTGLAAFYYESAQYPSDNGIYHYVKDIQGNIWGLIDSNGELIARDHYSAYGEYWSKWYVEEGPTSVLQRNNRVRNANPFHYRGYYYDTETGLYYCQSRYYDPDVGRWLNADGYVSTGQGVLGTNMFAYCGNNPVMYTDPSGQSWLALAFISVITLVISGCTAQPESNYGAASPYTPSDSTDYNCYAYALGEKEWKYVGGRPSAVKDFSVDNVAQQVLDDAKEDGRSMRIIDSFDSPIESNEYRIALRTGEADYHFMVQHNDGSWSHKPGLCSTRLIDGDNPSVVAWDAPTINSFYYYITGKVIEIGYVPNYYNSKTIYFAVSK